MLRVIRFGGAFPQVEVSADDGGLRRLAEVLMSASGSLEFSLLIDDHDEDAAVRGTASSTDVSSVRVGESENSLVQIMYADESNELLVSGGRDYLQILADNVAGLIGADPGSHQHIEWFEGHLYLDAESIPVVLAKRS